MKLTHILQIALACVVAGGGAAVPLLVSPMTPTAWLLLAIAEAGALGKVLSVQSEVAGDAPVAKLDAVTKAASKVLPLACLALCLVLTGCLSSAPVVPITPANQAQVSSCENTATLYDGLVVGDFTFTGAGATLGAIGALEPSTNASAKTDLAVGATVAGGLAVLTSALLGYSASNFANSQCSSVVGALPTIASKP